jgi:hypothetical protein
MNITIESVDRTETVVKKDVDADDLCDDVTVEEESEYDDSSDDELVRTVAYTTLSLKTLWY